MHLNKKQRIEIILMTGSASSRMVAGAFNRKLETSITHDTVAKLIVKFKKKSVLDQARCGRRQQSTYNRQDTYSTYTES